MEKGCCNLTLRTSCIIIGVLFLVACLINGVQVLAGTQVNDVSTPTMKIAQAVGLVLGIIANSFLLLGVRLNRAQFVFVWLVIQVIFFIYWPIQFLGTIFGFGGFAPGGAEFAIVSVIVQIISLAISIYVTLIVYSYHKELKKGQPEMQSVPSA